MTLAPSVSPARAVYGKRFVRRGRRFQRIVILEADLARSTYYDVDLGPACGPCLFTRAEAREEAIRLHALRRGRARGDPPLTGPSGGGT
jgi:hypothetical protein